MKMKGSLKYFHVCCGSVSEAPAININLYQITEEMQQLTVSPFSFIKTNCGQYYICFQKITQIETLKYLHNSRTNDTKFKLPFLASILQ